MTEVLNAILEYLFSKNINYIYACCFQNNLASKHLIEKCGFDFEQEGSFYAKTMNKNFDTYEFVFTRDEWNKKNSRVNTKSVKSNSYKKQGIF